MVNEGSLNYKKVIKRCSLKTDRFFVEPKMVLL